MLHLRPVGKREGVLYVNAQIANGALDLRVAEEDLHGAQVACLLINDGRLGSVQRIERHNPPGASRSQSPTHQQAEHIAEY